MKRKFVWLLLLFTISGSTWSHIDAEPAFADSQPYANGTEFYIELDWLNQVPWGNGTIEKAYRRGFHAVAGSPSNSWQKGTIILSFGRQIYQLGPGWGVVPIRSGTYKDNLWVKTVAQRFTDGYNDNPARQPVRIVVAVNNANYPWPCNNADPNNVSPSWVNAGWSWAAAVTNVLTRRQKVEVASGPDAEPWTGYFPNWVACGRGAERWLEGFEAAIGTRSALNFNYGSNAYAEHTVQWTQRQQFNISYGYRSAWALPQIYCASSNPPSIWSPAWVSLRQNFPGTTYWGVTSDNAQSTLCGTRSLTWQASWNDLNTRLVNAGYSNSLRGTAVHHFGR